MLVCDYIVERIDGDYAMLKRTNLPEEEAKMEHFFRKRSGKEAAFIMNYFSIQLLNKGMENVCALGLESAGAHFFQSVIFCLEIFQKILREMDVHI